MKKRFLVTLLVILPVSLCAQQQGDLGSWWMYFGQNRISDKFSLHSEIQYRNHKAFPGDIEQLLLRTGLNFHFHGKSIASAGYAYIASHDYESEDTAPESEEHRIWQQLLLYQNVGRVKFEHRYRVEQRWVNNDYRNRLRYRVMVTVPLNHATFEPGTWFIAWYDEIFVNTEQTFFDRNRFYGAVGYQFNPATSVQLGALNQRVSSFGKWYLQAAIIFNPDLRKREVEN